MPYRIPPDTLDYFTRFTLCLDKFRLNIELGFEVPLDWDYRDESGYAIKDLFLFKANFVYDPDQSTKGFSVPFFKVKEE